MTTPAKPGRKPVPDELRRVKVQTTLPQDEIDQLKKIGNGQISTGISKLLFAYRREQAAKP